MNQYVVLVDEVDAPIKVYYLVASSKKVVLNRMKEELCFPKYDLDGKLVDGYEREEEPIIDINKLSSRVIKDAKAGEACLVVVHNIDQ